MKMIHIGLRSPCQSIRGFLADFREVMQSEQHLGILTDDDAPTTAPDLSISYGTDLNTPKVPASSADITSGSLISHKAAAQYAARLDISPALMHTIIWLSGARPEPATAIILSGGKSRRMGRDKATLSLNGKPMAQHLCDLLSPWFDEVLLSVAGDAPPPITAVRTVRDLVPGKGPLAGLYSGVSASANRINFIVACDIPEVNLPLMRKLLSFSTNYDIAVPSFTRGQNEPLFGMYTKNILSHVEKLLDGNRLRIADLYRLCRATILETTNDGWYRNLNTQEEYAAYVASVKG